MPDSQVQHAAQPIPGRLSLSPVLQGSLYALMRPSQVRTRAGHGRLRAKGLGAFLPSLWQASDGLAGLENVE